MRVAQRSVGVAAFLVACCAVPWPCLADAVSVALESRLPDGTEFTFWERPLTFSRTYYVDGGSPKSDDRGPGT